MINGGVGGGISVARSNSLRNTSPPARRKYQPDGSHPSVPEDGHMGQIPNRGTTPGLHPQYHGPPPYSKDPGPDHSMRQDPYNRQDSRDSRNHSMYADRNNRDPRDNRYPNENRHPGVNRYAHDSSLEMYDSSDYPNSNRLQPPRDDYQGSHPNSREQSFEYDRRSDDFNRRKNDSFDSYRRDHHDMSPPRNNQIPSGGRSPQHPSRNSGYPDEPRFQQYPNSNGTIPRQPQDMQGFNTLQKTPQMYDRVSILSKLIYRILVFCQYEFSSLTHVRDRDMH